MRKENQLLSRITKLFNNPTEEKMEKEDKQAEASAVDFKEQLAAANEALASKGAEFAAAVEQLKEMSSKLEAAQAALDAIAAEKAKMAAEALAVKLAARKEKIVAAIGTEKAEGLLSATGNLDDAAFEAVVSAMAGSVAVEANSEMFKEVGVDAKADAAKVVGESDGVMNILKTKYKRN